MTKMSFYRKHSAFNPAGLLRRELGYSSPIGAGDAISKSLYCGMKPIASWDNTQSSFEPHGGVFNLEFSPSGSLLVAACEKKSIQIFDPLTHKRIHTVNQAHQDCVNCVKFLDGRMFATCSDDTTIALWDVRNLKKKIRTLQGHSNWVKNIEYSVKDNLLVTSGLDGSIYTWDINSYTEWSLVYQRVFHASGLMRCRISPDASQMVMCTTGGLLIIVHNLNLSTLAHDLQGFKPNLYRLMQTSNQVIPMAANFDRLFDHKREENRVEFVSDFPEGNDAEVVSSLQIHPQGWCALSRNISHDDKSEWTCVHDIQADTEWSEFKSGRPSHPRVRLLKRATATRRTRISARVAQRSPADDSSNSGSSSSRTRGTDCPRQSPRARGEVPGLSAGSSGLRDDRGSDTETEPDPGPSRSIAPEAPSTSRQLFSPVSGIQNDVWEASITIKQHRTLQEMTSRGQVGRNFNMQRILGINTGITPPAASPRVTRRTSNTPPATITQRIRPSSSGAASRPSDMDDDDPSPPEPPRSPSTAIRQNKERLLYYVEETNEGKGFIKELCFSSDGRIVCSPFGYGIRLFSLNDHCSELSQCVSDYKLPRPLVELGQSIVHTDLVVSSKFSPRHHLLVTGCLAGKIVWYQPHSGEI